VKYLIAKLIQSSKDSLKLLKRRKLKLYLITKMRNKKKNM